jgi:multidrug transporter EmrE-like cation transporter
MDRATQGWLAVCVSITLCELGSYALKTSPLHGMTLSAICWIASSLLWVMILPRLPLSTSSAVYSVGTLIASVLMGVVVFHEALTTRTTIGCVLGLVAVILLL